MIVLESPPGLLVVRQVEHAAASAALAAAWRAPEFLTAGLWRQFVRAVRFHDHGWIEEEKRPSLDLEGRPLDFKTVPAPTHIGIWRRSLALASELHPYVRLLVARHGRGLYLQFPKKPTIEEQRVSDDFVRELDAHIEAARGVIRESGDEGRRAAEDESLETAARIFGFVDVLSLALLRALPLPEETEALAFEDTGGRVRLRREGDGVRVDPWPFRTPRLALEIQSVDLPARTFRDPEACALAIGAREPRRLRREILPG